MTLSMDTAQALGSDERLVARQHLHSTAGSHAYEAMMCTGI
jgi:hypothetical protein